MLLMSLPAQIKYIVLSIMFVIASINFTRTALDILQNSKRLESLQTEVSVLEFKQEELNNSIAYKKSVDFVEERARNALNMIKPNEKVFVASTNVLGETVALEAPIKPKAPLHEETALAMWVKLLLL